jgi:hypothetical protein
MPMMLFMIGKALAAVGVFPSLNSFVRAGFQSSAKEVLTGSGHLVEAGMNSLPPIDQQARGRNQSSERRLDLRETKRLGCRNSQRCPGGFEFGFNLAASGPIDSSAQLSPKFLNLNLKFKGHLSRIAHATGKAGDWGSRFT